MRAVLWLLVLAGCEVADPMGQVEDTGSHEYEAPCLEVSPVAIAFEPVEVGVDPPRTEVITLTNACEGELRILDIALEHPDYPFVLGAVGTPWLTAGSSTELSLTFSPWTSAAWSSDLLISSSDPEQPVVAVDLYGEGVAPVIDLATDCDFGRTWVGCTDECAVTIMNIGNADLVVEGFDFDTFSTDRSSTPPPSGTGSSPSTSARAWASTSTSTGRPRTPGRITRTSPSPPTTP